MKVLILAAGFSTRLYPLTENFPKGLLKIKGQPIITHALDEVLKVSEFKDLALITNQIAFPYFQNFLNENKKYQQIKLLDNGVNEPKASLGAIGDLVLALDKLGWNDELLVLTSDTLVSLDFAELLEFYQVQAGFINVVYDAQDKEIIREKLGCAQLDGEKLVGFEEKPLEPKSTFQSVPIYIYPKKDLELIRAYANDKNNNLDSPGAIIPFLIEKTKTYAFQVKDGFYYDVGTKEVLEKLQNS